MSNLDDKILGEKQHYYCSSSDDDNDDDYHSKPFGSRDISVQSKIKWEGSSCNVCLFNFVRFF